MITTATAAPDKTRQRGPGLSTPLFCDYPTVCVNWKTENLKERVPVCFASNCRLAIMAWISTPFWPLYSIFLTFHVSVWFVFVALKGFFIHLLALFSFWGDRRTGIALFSRVYREMRVLLLLFFLFSEWSFDLWPQGGFIRPVLLYVRSIRSWCYWLVLRWLPMYFIYYYKHKIIGCSLFSFFYFMISALWYSWFPL